MNPGDPVPPQDIESEIAALIEVMRLTGQRLETLTAGEVDAVTYRDGRTVMLQRAQEHMRRSDAAKQAAILDALPAHIAMLDPRGAIVSVNEAWRRHAHANPVTGMEYPIGLDYAENCDRVIGKDAAEAQQVAAGVRAVLAGRSGSFAFEYQSGLPSERRWFLGTIAPLAYEHVHGAVVMHMEITAQKRVEEESRRFVAAMDAVADAVYLVDRSSLRFVHVNDAACRDLGKTRAEALALEPWSILSMSRAALDSDYAALIASGAAGAGVVSAKPVELLRNRKDGSQVWVELRRHAQRSEGRWTIVTLVRDINERKLAEQARQSLEAQLRESQKMEAIGTLAGGVAHDFNNILGAILGNTELARLDAAASPLALESLEEIRKAGLRARELVQQILAFSRRQPATRRVISLVPVVKETVRMLRATISSQISFDLQFPDPPPVVLADSIQMQQALINLVTNAAHAMHGCSGKITIGVEAIHLEEGSKAPVAGMPPGRYARLTVSDTGHGMDAATLGRVFEPFFTTKPTGEGTGLGLSVVHGIVRAHEGHIAIASAAGAGCTFGLYFPMVSTVPADHDIVPIAPVVTAVAGSGRRILYIDDDESMLFLVKRLLQRRDFKVSVHSDQQAALRALRADPHGFSLVLTDYNMPGLSGLDVANQVRNIRPDLPVAMVSGFITDELRARAAEVGVSELIFKPNVVDEFCDVIQRLVPDGQ